MIRYPVSLFIFRRDLRIYDNTALNQALRLSERVIPCFIADPRQIEAHPYQSVPGLRFLLQSINDLQRQLQTVSARLLVCHDRPEQIIRQLFDKQRIQAVFINRDYTPFSRRRDEELADVCRRLGIALHSFSDALLLEPEQALKSDQTPYKVFTAFYNNARRLPVALPETSVKQNFLPVLSDLAVDPAAIFAVHEDKSSHVAQGGRDQALRLINQLNGCADYQKNRDFPALDATSKLSAHLKFGTCSVREVYYAVTRQLGSEHPLLRQLYWRDFFTHIAWHFPRVFGHAFLEQFDAVPWDNNPDYFQAWCTGNTGFPIVDAGMRELNSTGFMHNRLRMITASFLVKDLHISWLWGERYFARHLLDYDPCVNNGNWQWAASTGCDAQPYFRIFNPWLQQQKFDPDCRYIYQWLPELKDLPQKTIHHWDKKYSSACAYPAPIVDHSRESRISKLRFKEAMNA